MADEARITSSLQILSSKLQYYSRPITFTGDVIGSKGGVPGAIAVALAGTNVDFSELTTPGYCRIQNLDDTNYVEYGIYDPETYKFYPLGELLAGETYVFRFSRNLAAEYGTGTGTTGASTNQFQLKAYGSACDVLIEAFEK